MNAEIINIGDELLIGQVVNTNASWMAQQLNDAGADVVHISCIADQGAAIMDAMASAIGRADLVLLTGGLGPTRDDITKKVLCDYFNTKLILDEQVLENIRSFFSRKGLPLTGLNRDQALVPEGATILENPVGTAPGIAFERNNKWIVSMPGVPYEMKHIMESYVLPRLVNGRKNYFIVHKTILTQGIGESFLTDKLSGWEENLPKDIKLAYLPSPGIVRLRLSMRGKNRASMQKVIFKQVRLLEEKIPQFIWGFDNDKLEEVVGKLLKKKSLSISTAESCTGGYIAHRLTSVPGSSHYFRGSVVAYDNEVKKDVLEVPGKLLKSHGAVSREVVERMAVGVRERLHSDFSIATTGVAGPGGGTEEKPVGTVWIAIATREKVISEKFQFGDQRDRNIIRTAFAALNMIRKALL